MAHVNVELARSNSMMPWGFRLQGGTDYRMALSVAKVNAGSPVENRIHAGDAIVAIQGYDASKMTHGQASNYIKSSGNRLQMTVIKGKHPQRGSMGLRPSGPIKFKPTAVQNSW